MQLFLIYSIIFRIKYYIIYWYKSAYSFQKEINPYAIEALLSHTLNFQVESPNRKGCNWCKKISDYIIYKNMSTGKLHKCPLKVQ